MEERALLGLCGEGGERMRILFCILILIILNTPTVIAEDIEYYLKDIAISLRNREIIEMTKARYESALGPISQLSLLDRILNNKRFVVRGLK